MLYEVITAGGRAGDRGGDGGLRRRGRAAAAAGLGALPVV